MEDKNKIVEATEKKSSNKIFVILEIVVLILVVVFILNYKGNNYNSGNNIKSGNNKNIINKYQTKSDNQASVNIDITPKKLGVAEEKNIFEISFNTHSVYLGYDFQKIIILKDNLGNIYQALEWTGGKGGHHINGEIIFPKINKDAKTIEMEIDGVGGVKRFFKWNL